MFLYGSSNPGSGPASSGCFEKHLYPSSLPVQPPTSGDTAAALPRCLLLPTNKDKEPEMLISRQAEYITRINIPLTQTHQDLR